MTEYIKCGDCMRGAPYPAWCCKLECGKRQRCKNCESKARGDHCPNEDIYFADDKKETGNAD